MKRRIYRLRIRFHDWMWNGGDRTACGLARRACRRLPLYFSDPHAPGRRHMKRITTSPRVEIRTPPGGPRIRRVESGYSGTASSGSAATYYVDWPA